MMVDISQENKDEFLNKVVGYKHSVAACNSVSMASTSGQLRQAKLVARLSHGTDGPPPRQLQAKL